jgi:uncharacterized OsmC-like protein
MSEHYATCSWTPGSDYLAQTPNGAVPMFTDGGHRAVELMLMSAAACLNFFLVEYAQARKLPVERLAVRCDGEVVQHPERVARIHTTIEIDGGLSDADAKKMVHICERACKVMNTFREPPECLVTIENGTGTPTKAKTPAKAKAKAPTKAKAKAKTPTKANTKSGNDGADDAALPAGQAG